MHTKAKNNEQVVRIVNCGKSEEEEERRKEIKKTIITFCLRLNKLKKQYALLSPSKTEKLPFKQLFEYIARNC